MRPSWEWEGLAELVRAIKARAIIGTVVSQRFRLLDEDDRGSPALTDPSYLPAWLHLGRALRPATVVEYGAELALVSGSVALGASPEHVLTIQDAAGGDFNWRLAQSNLRDSFRGTAVVHTGRFDGAEFQDDLQSRLWDLAIVNQSGADGGGLLAIMRSLHARLAPKGVMAVDFAGRDRPAERAFEEFCKSRSLEPLVLPTRYGVGVVGAC